MMMKKRKEDRCGKRANPCVQCPSSHQDASGTLVLQLLRASERPARSGRLQNLPEERVQWYVYPKADCNTGAGVCVCVCTGLKLSNHSAIFGIKDG